MRDRANPSSAAGRVIAAARRHFLAQGFRRVTMDDLAEELGMSKKTLYACFPGKKELVRAVMEQKLGEAEVELDAITSRRGDVRAGLARAVECIQRQTQEVQPPFIRDVRREAPELFATVESRRREAIYRHFGGLLRDGRRDGVIRRDIPVHLLIEILLGAVQSVLNPPKMMELNLTPGVAFPAIMKVFLEGIVTAKAKGEQ
jgi:AcrR family transcriptional regulator